jgi:hypothetical protein
VQKLHRCAASWEEHAHQTQSTHMHCLTAWYIHQQTIWPICITHNISAGLMEPERKRGLAQTCLNIAPLHQQLCLTHHHQPHIMTPCLQLQRNLHCHCTTIRVTSNEVRTIARWLHCQHVQRIHYSQPVQGRVHTIFNNAGTQSIRHSIFNNALIMAKLK